MTKKSNKILLHYVLILTNKFTITAIRNSKVNNCLDQLYFVIRENKCTVELKQKF